MAVLVLILDYQTGVTPLAKSPILSDRAVYLIQIVLKITYVLSEVDLTVLKVVVLISTVVTHGVTVA